MRDRSIRRIKEAAAAKAPVRHSDMYKWLRDRHRGLAKVLDAFDPGWEPIRQEMEATGVRDQRGRAPSCDSIRRIWRRVCRDIEEAQKALSDQPRGAKRPNRSPREAKEPPLALARVKALVPGSGGETARLSPASVARRHPAEEVRLSPEAQAKFARLDAQLRHADRYLGLPPLRKKAP